MRVMQIYTGRNVGHKECANEKPLFEAGNSLRSCHEYSDGLPGKHSIVDQKTAMLEQYSIRATDLLTYLLHGVESFLSS